MSNQRSSLIRKHQGGEDDAYLAATVWFYSSHYCVQSTPDWTVARIVLQSFGTSELAFVGSPAFIGWD